MNTDTQVNINNPQSSFKTSLLHFLISAWDNRNLIFQLTKRDITSRYKGSIVGLAWAVFNPIFMLAVYTFVFTVVFKARWGSESLHDQVEFSALIFVGMLIHGFFADTLIRAPNLIIQNVNYVKKVVFPIEVLPLTSLLVSGFYSLIGLVVLLISFLVLKGFLNWTIIFLPILILPFAFFTLGFSFFLASTGVYLRDISQIMGMLTSVLLFLSPVFYPLSAVPEKFIPFIMLNPLTFVIQESRSILIFGHLPNWNTLFIYTVLSLLVAWAGLTIFQRLRRGFADVL